MKWSQPLDKNTRTTFRNIRRRLLNGRLLIRSACFWLCQLYFITNVAFAHQQEISFWSQRQKAVQDFNATKLAGLPAGFQLPAPSGLLSQTRPILPLPPRGTKGGLLESLPLAYGSLRDASSLQGSSVTVIHIQDVHLNPEAQANIHKTLETLIREKKVDLVALEGTFDPIDLSGFKKFSHQDIIKTVADYLLEENSISGPIYTLLTSGLEATPAFVGIDDKSHYDANVQAYKDSSLRLKDTKDKLALLDQHLALRKASVYNAQLLSFDQTVQAYHKNQMKVGEYVKFLVSGSKLQTPGSIAIFLQALELENRLNFSQVEQERSELLSHLVTKLSKQQTSELLNYSVAYRLGQIRHAEFYRYLEGLCLKNGINLSGYPAMDSYIRYVLLSDQIKPEELIKETRNLEVQGYAFLAKTQEEKKLIQESRHSELEGKLLDFALTPEEWKEYQSVPSDTLLNLFSFESFYKEAENRDQAMAQNLLGAIKSNNAKIVVLITGGFHSQGMDQRLKEAGISTISFVPKITHVDSDKGSAYLSVFTQEKTPLQKLFEGERLFLTPQILPNQGSIAMMVEGDAALHYPITNLTTVFRELAPKEQVRKVTLEPEGQASILDALGLNGTEKKVRVEEGQNGLIVTPLTETSAKSSKILNITHFYTNIRRLIQKITNIPHISRITLISILLAISLYALKNQPHQAGIAVILALGFGVAMVFQTPKGESEPAEERNFQVSVKPDQSYSVMMTHNVFDPANPLLKNQVQDRKVFVIVDGQIGEKQIQEIKNYLAQNAIVNREDLEKHLLVLPGGEQVKDGEAGRTNMDAISQAADKAGLSRKDVFVIVGGGATLDVAGFAASEFHRGVPYIRIPTTLLAQIDAGVGVKTGINYFDQKNFYGAFYPPQSVIVDPLLLSALDTRQMRSGMAEAIKVSLMKDRDFFDLIEKGYQDLLNKNFGAGSVAEEIMWLCIVRHLEQIKTDPFERELARPLDYGHEWGHRLETVTNHKITHGEGVAIGMAIDTYISYKRGYIGQADLERVLTLIENVGLPIYDERATVDNLWPGLESFRRHLGGELTISLLGAIGQKKDVNTMEKEELEAALAYLKDRSNVKGTLEWLELYLENMRPLTSSAEQGTLRGRDVKTFVETVIQSRYPQFDPGALPTDKVPAGLDLLWNIYQRVKETLLIPHGLYFADDELSAKSIIGEINDTQIGQTPMGRSIPVIFYTALDDDMPARIGASEGAVSFDVRSLDKLSQTIDYARALRTQYGSPLSITFSTDSLSTRPPFLDWIDRLSLGGTENQEEVLGQLGNEILLEEFAHSDLAYTLNVIVGKDYDNPTVTDEQRRDAWRRLLRPGSSLNQLVNSITERPVYGRGEDITALYEIEAALSALSHPAVPGYRFARMLFLDPSVKMPKGYREKPDQIVLSLLKPFLSPRTTDVEAWRKELNLLAVRGSPEDLQRLNEQISQAAQAAYEANFLSTEERLELIASSRTGRNGMSRLALLIPLGILGIILAHLLGLDRIMMPMMIGVGILGMAISKTGPESKYPTLESAERELISRGEKGWESTATALTKGSHKDIALYNAIFKFATIKYPTPESVQQEITDRTKRKWGNNARELQNGNHPDIFLRRAAREYQIPLPKSSGEIISDSSPIKPATKHEVQQFNRSVEKVQTLTAETKALIDNGNPKLALKQSAKAFKFLDEAGRLSEKRADWREITESLYPELRDVTARLAFYARNPHREGFLKTGMLAALAALSLIVLPHSLFTEMAVMLGMGALAGVIMNSRENQPVNPFELTISKANLTRLDLEDRALFMDIIGGGPEAQERLLRERPEKVTARPDELGPGATEGRTLYLILKKPLLVGKRIITVLRFKAVRLATELHQYEGRGYTPFRLKPDSEGGIQAQEGLIKPQGGNYFELIEQEFNAYVDLSKKGFHVDTPLWLGKYHRSFKEHSVEHTLGFAVFGMESSDWRLRITREEDDEKGHWYDNPFSNREPNPYQLTPFSYMAHAADAAPAIQRMDFAKKIGQTLRRLHDAGFYHQMFHSGSIGILPSGQVTIRDWETVLRRWKGTDSRRLTLLRLIDMERLTHDLLNTRTMVGFGKKVSAEPLIKPFLEGYFLEAETEELDELVERMKVVTVIFHNFLMVPGLPLRWEDIKGKAGPFLDMLKTAEESSPQGGPSLTPPSTYVFARRLLPQLGIAYTPRRTELLVAWWYELLPSGRRFWESSLLPWFVLFHNNKGEDGKIKLRVLLTRLFSHLFIILPLTFVPFFFDWSLHIQIISALFLHMGLHFSHNLLFPGAPLSLTRKKDDPQLVQRNRAYLYLLPMENRTAIEATYPMEGTASIAQAARQLHVTPKVLSDREQKGLTLLRVIEKARLGDQSLRIGEAADLLGLIRDQENPTAPVEGIASFRFKTTVDAAYLLSLVSHSGLGSLKVQMGGAQNKSLAQVECIVRYEPSAPDNPEGGYVIKILRMPKDETKQWSWQGYRLARSGNLEEWNVTDSDFIPKRLKKDIKKNRLDPEEVKFVFDLMVNRRVDGGQLEGISPFSLRVHITSAEFVSRIYRRTGQRANLRVGKKGGPLRIQLVLGSSGDYVWKLEKETNGNGATVRFFVIHGGRVEPVSAPLNFQAATVVSEETISMLVYKLGRITNNSGGYVDDPGFWRMPEGAEIPDPDGTLPEAGLDRMFWIFHRPDYAALQDLIMTSLQFLAADPDNLYLFKGRHLVELLKIEEPEVMGHKYAKSIKKSAYRILNLVIEDMGFRHDQERIFESQTKILDYYQDFLFRTAAISDRIDSNDNELIARHLTMTVGFFCALTDSALFAEWHHFFERLTELELDEHIPAGFLGFGLVWIASRKVNNSLKRYGYTLAAPEAKDFMTPRFIYRLRKIQDNRTTDTSLTLPSTYWAWSFLPRWIVRLFVAPWWEFFQSQNGQKYIDDHDPHQTPVQRGLRQIGVFGMRAGENLASFLLIPALTRFLQYQGILPSGFVVWTLSLFFATLSCAVCMLYKNTLTEIASRAPPSENKFIYFLLNGPDLIAVSLLPFIGNTLAHFLYQITLGWWAPLTKGGQDSWKEGFNYLIETIESMTEEIRALHVDLASGSATIAQNALKSAFEKYVKVHNLLRMVQLHAQENPAYQPKVRSLNDDFDKATAPLLPYIAGPVGQEKPFILHVEDDDGFAITIRTFLESSDYKVVLAKSYDEALQVLETEHVDMVISDWNLRGSKDGGAVFNEVRQRFPQMPFMFYSSYSEKEIKTRINLPADVVIMTAEKGRDGKTKILQMVKSLLNPGSTGTTGLIPWLKYRVEPWVRAALGQKWGERIYRLGVGPLIEEVVFSGIPLVMGIALKGLNTVNSHPILVNSLFISFFVLTRVIFVLLHNKGGEAFPIIISSFVLAPLYFIGMSNPSNIPIVFTALLVAFFIHSFFNAFEVDWAVTKWINTLNDPSAPEDKRSYAAWQLSRVGGPRRSIPVMFKALLQDPSEEVHFWIVRTLEKIGPEVVRIAREKTPKSIPDIVAAILPQYISKRDAQFTELLKTFGNDAVLPIKRAIMNQEVGSPEEQRLLAVLKTINLTEEESFEKLLNKEHRPGTSPDAPDSDGRHFMASPARMPGYDAESLGLPSDEDLLAILQRENVGVVHVKPKDPAYVFLIVDTILEIADYLRSIWDINSVSKGISSKAYGVHISRIGNWIKGIAHKLGLPSDELRERLALDPGIKSLVVLQADRRHQRTFFEETIHALEGEPADSPLWIDDPQEVVNDFIQLLFLDPRHLNQFYSTYTDWTLNEKEFLYERYVIQPGLNPNTQLVQILENLRNDLEQESPMFSPTLAAPLTTLLYSEDRVNEIIRELKNRSMIPRRHYLIGKETASLLCSDTIQYLYYLLRSQRFSRYLPLFPHWTLRQPDRPLPSASWVFPELEKSYKRTLFISLLHLLDRNLWLIQGKFSPDGHNEYIYQDKKALKFDEHGLNRMEIYDMTDEQFNDAVRIAGDIIRDRIALGKLHDMRVHHPGDEGKMRGMAKYLGIPIPQEPKQPKSDTSGVQVAFTLVALVLALGLGDTPLLPIAGLISAGFLLFKYVSHRRQAPRDDASQIETNLKLGPALNLGIEGVLGNPFGVAGHEVNVNERQIQVVEVSQAEKVDKLLAPLLQWQKTNPAMRDIIIEIAPLTDSEESIARAVDQVMGRLGSSETKGSVIQVRHSEEKTKSYSLESVLSSAYRSSFHSLGLSHVALIRTTERPWTALPPEGIHIGDLLIPIQNIVSYLVNLTSGEVKRIDLNTEIQGSQAALKAA